MTFKSRLTALVLCGLAGPAFADGEVDKIITPADRERLTQLEQSRKQGFAEAAADAETDFDTLKALQTTMAKRVMSFRDFDMTGNWQCRTIKLGSYAPFVAYGWFKCRVTDDGSGWMLEKLAGSQKTKGRFYDDTDTRLIYLGAGYVNNDPAPPYGKEPKSDQVGYAFRTGKNEWRIEFPGPYYESKLDILEFRR